MRRRLRETKPASSETNNNETTRAVRLAAPLRVTQADKRPPVREQVQSNQQRCRTAGAWPLDETLGHAAVLFEGFPENRTEGSDGDLKAIEGPSEQAFGRPAGKDEPLFGIEQQDAFFQTLEHAAYAAAEIGRGPRGVSHLRAQQAQLRLDSGELGRRRVRGGFRYGLAMTDEVDVFDDAAEVARDEAGQQRDK